MYFKLPILLKDVSTTYWEYVILFVAWKPCETLLIHQLIIFYFQLNPKPAFVLFCSIERNSNISEPPFPKLMFFIFFIFQDDVSTLALDSMPLLQPLIPIFVISISLSFEAQHMHDISKYFGYLLIYDECNVKMIHTKLYSRLY